MKDKLTVKTVAVKRKLIYKTFSLCRLGLLGTIT